MSFIQFIHIIRADLYRYWGASDLFAFIKAMLMIPGFNFTFWLRTTQYLRHRKFMKYIFYLPSRLILLHYTYKYGIEIPVSTKIDKGFYIGHFGGIVISGNATIGKNCNISHQVTIGLASRGSRKGVPTIGDNVYIGPGAKLIGNIKIGSNSAIGANSVVTKDVPENAVVAGIPAEIISYRGSEGYILRIEYE